METLKRVRMIERFLAAARAWVGSEMTARELIAAFVEFNREIAVSDVDPDGGDRFLLSAAGATAPHLIDAPTNLVGAPDSEVQFSDKEHRYIGLSRELWPRQSEVDVEDNADDGLPSEIGIGLSLFLFFDPPLEADRFSTDQSASPDELEAKLARFFEEPLVAEVLGSRPTKITAFASGIG
ncbi:MAG TPA: hypothetical protein VGQ99_09730 [Tepidisphaeraceae bacterium]|jgi:hypothetical protein|nr:hypothetical protein [Tepidisphaeraceae bacterium]